MSPRGEVAAVDVVKRVALIAALVAPVLASLPVGGLGPSEARADDLTLELPVFGASTFSMTSTTSARYRGQNFDANPLDDDFFSIAQRFDLALQGDELRLEMRLDGFLPFAVGDVPWAASQRVSGTCPVGTPREAYCILDWDLRPERVTLRWEHGDWTLEGGDAQLVLGRGIALAFRKVDLLGVDTSLRGGHVRYDDGAFRFRLHGGVANPQNQDPRTLAILRERDDVVAAATAGVTLPDSTIAVSGHALRMWFADDAGGAARGRAVDVAGWTFEAPSLLDGALSLYAEANGMRRSVTFGDDPEQLSFGRAVYASAQVQVEGLTVLAEWKDYRDFLVAPSLVEGNAWRVYSAPPSLEVSDGPQRVRAIGNQRGGSLRVDYAFLPGPWSFSVNSSLYGLGEAADEDPWDGILVSHSWATLTRRQEYGDDVNWGLELTGGFRQETYLHDPQPASIGVGDLDRRLAHGRAEVTLGSGDHSLEVSLDHARFEERIFLDVYGFEQGGVGVTYSWGVPFAATVALRWYDEKADEIADRAARYGVGELYPSLDLRWNFDPGTFVRAFVGATPGGRLCSGGVCRDVPPFEGALVQFVGRL